MCTVRLLMSPSRGQCVSICAYVKGFQVSMSVSCCSVDVSATQVVYGAGNSLSTQIVNVDALVDDAIEWQVVVGNEL